METNVFQGELYFIRDNVRDNKNYTANSHYYVVIHGGEEDTKMSRVNCFSISSFRGTESRYKIPVFLNNCKSYLYPLNIHSVDRQAFRPESRKGLVCSNLRQSAKVLELALETFFAFALEDTAKMQLAKEHIDAYCKEFDAMYPNCAEYREAYPKKEGFEPELPTSKYPSLSRGILATFPQESLADIDNWMMATIDKLDNQPRFYNMWTASDLVPALVLFTNYDYTAIIQKSTRFNSAKNIQQAAMYVKKAIKDKGLSSVYLLIGDDLVPVSLSSDATDGITIKSSLASALSSLVTGLLKASDKYKVKTIKIKSNANPISRRK